MASITMARRRDVAAKPMRVMAAPNVRRVWWIDPAWCLLGLILPIYVLSAWLGGPLMPEFGSKNFLTPAAIGLGVCCIAALAAGCKMGEFASGKLGRRSHSVDPRRFDHVLVALGYLCLAANLIYIGGAFSNPDAVVAMLRGELGAIYEVKEGVNKIVGLTTITNVAPLFFTMAALRKVYSGSRMPSRLGGLFWMIVFVTVFRAFAASERLIVVEAAIAYMLPIFSFGPRRFPLISLFPLAGILGVFVLFAAGEYTRSWQYNIGRYDSFLQFVSLRALAYISVASNTSIGMLETWGPIDFPYMTAAWLRRIPFVAISVEGPMAQFFETYGNMAFTNPGGVTNGINDFGIFFGIIYYIFSGTIVGWFYKSYLNRSSVGAILYPLFFIGVVFIIQLIYWGDPKMVTPVLIFVALAIYIQRPNRSVRTATALGT